ncbi:MAG TPA: C-terminal binding protein, partial [Dehalococcoidia bacterium]|nr:C-terminal binding protein [Dehalococcoidia bacterium]
MTVNYPGIPPDEKVLTDIGAQFAKIPCHSEEELIATAQDADAIITIPMNQLFPRRVIERLNKCRIISSPGIGYEGIDLAAATERGICVTNVPDYCLEEVSDHAMALLLACARKLFRLDKAVKEGKWDSLEKPQIRNKIWPPMFRIRGQTVGLIGFGRIPRALVPKAKGFGLRVIAHDPYAPPGIAEELGVELVDLDRLLRESDYVSVHAALTAETKHMLGLEQFKKMKPTAYLINAARGPLIDETALYTALSEGYIAGAGLDVMDPEPPSLDNPLFKLDNVIFTAHSAHYSELS